VGGESRVWAGGLNAPDLSNARLLGKKGVKTETNRSKKTRFLPRNALTAGTDEQREVKRELSVRLRKNKRIWESFHVLGQKATQEKIAK